MIAFYAMGGGWGHLTRIKTFIENRGITAPYKVITANRNASVFFAEQNVLLIPADEQTTAGTMKEQLRSTLEPFRFTACYVDVFPNGVLGELSPELVPAATFHYLGRRLRWAQYEPFAKDTIVFDTTFLFEEVEPAHFQFIEKQSKKVTRLPLHYPPADSSFSHPLIEQEHPIWLIVHTSIPEEVGLLVDHAQDIALIENMQPCLVVLSNERINRPGIQWLRGQNPIDWYPKVGRIFTAAGFNSWKQLAPWREKHVCLPFPRRFDDQYWRCQQKDGDD